MTSGYSVNGTDLDSILALFASGQSHPANVGYEVGGTDISQRYAAASYGSAYGTTNYKVSNGNYTAGTDIGNIFAKAGSLGTPLTLYAVGGSPGSGFAGIGLLGTSQSNTNANENIWTPSTDYGPFVQNGSSSLPSSGGWWGTVYLSSYFNSTILQGHTLKSGTGTISLGMQPVAGPLGVYYTYQFGAQLVIATSNTSFTRIGSPAYSNTFTAAVESPYQSVTQSFNITIPSTAISSGQYLGAIFALYNSGGLSNVVVNFLNGSLEIATAGYQ